MIRSLAIRAGLAAAMIACSAVPVAAQQTTPERFAQAVASLSERLGPIETGPAIDTTDAAANAADLATIEAALDVLGTPDFPVGGFETLTGVCEPLTKLSVRHGLDGLAAIARPAGAPPPTEAETAAIVSQVLMLQMRNAARYQDAVTVLSGGGVRCMVQLFPAMTEFLANLPASELTPTRLSGAQQMRRGGAQALLGFALAMREAGTSPVNRARMRAYVAEVAAPLAAALTPEARTGLTTALDQLPPTQDADALASTALLKAALATTGCEGLCRY